MVSMGYKIIPNSKTFFSDTWAEAIGAKKRQIDDAFLYAQKIGFPVVVKPNSGSQGTGVALVHTKQEFYKAVQAIFKHDKIVLVQPFVEGNDYRVVVLDKEIISAYQRIPLCVTGDGKSSIQTLLEKKQKEFLKQGRDTKINFGDPRIKTKLKNQKLRLQSVVGKEETVYLLDNANLSTGGDSIDVTNDIHPAFKKLAVELTSDMGLRLCGVDLMVHGDIKNAPAEYWILEINSAPGLDHYAKMGKAQEEVVESLYLEVLRHMER
jgi:D-alanine-D-alanine ligase-like ATP-grasp enzyme